VASFVEVTRGSVVESRHLVHAVVVHAERGVVASCGDPRHVSFVRSAIKMFQALPLAEDRVIDERGFSGEEIALCAASHNAEPFHVDAALRLLRKANADEAMLVCGPHEPMYPPAAEALKRAGEAPRRVHNNCSGKHAGMLALASHHGWPASGYQRPDHPVQQRVAQTLARWTGVDAHRMNVATDGCGLPTFGLPLDRVAAACAKFAGASLDGGPESAIARAMMRHPEFVAGTGRLDTVLMLVAAGRLFAKVGAEGYYCAGVPEQRLGIALKIEDGAKRASEPALLAILRRIDALSDVDLDQLREFSHPMILNTRDAIVGEVRASIQLDRGAP
jgi:L-asparaginase II